MLKQRVKKVVINTFILLVLYGNVNGMLSSWKVRFEPSSFISNSYFSNLFYIYGVFLEVHRFSREYVALGSREKLGEAPLVPTPEMIDLNLYSYFPQSHGEANQRLAFAGYLNQPERRAESYNRMASIIKRLHNQQHPDAPVENVFIYLYSWPADPDGYYRRSNESTVQLLGSD